MSPRLPDYLASHLRVVICGTAAAALLGTASDLQPGPKPGARGWHRDRGTSGIGLYTDQSIGFGDLPAITGVTHVVGAGYVLVNVLVDLAQALADPRIRL